MVLEFWDRRFSSFCGTNGPHFFSTNGSQFFGQTVLTFWDNTVGATEKYILCHAHGIGHALSGDKACQKRYIVSPAEEPQRVSKKDCLIRKRTKKKVLPLCRGTLTLRSRFLPLRGGLLRSSSCRGDRFFKFVQDCSPFSALAFS